MRLSSRQQAFVTEYVTDHNAPQAAIRAGYSAKTARVLGSRTLGNIEVAQAIAKLDEERRERLGVSANWVLEKLVAVVEKSMKGAPRTSRDGKPIIVEVDGETITFMDWSPSGQ